jgi:hypothetical protein
VLLGLLNGLPSASLKDWHREGVKEKHDGRKS